MDLDLGMELDMGMEMEMEMVMEVRKKRWKTNAFVLSTANDVYPTC